MFIPDRAITPIYYHSWHIKSATHRPYRCSFTQLNFWITDFCSFPYRAIDLIGTKLVDLNFLSTWYQFMTFTNHVRETKANIAVEAFQALISSSVLFSKMCDTIFHCHKGLHWPLQFWNQTCFTVDGANPPTPPPQFSEMNTEKDTGMLRSAGVIMYCESALRFTAFMQW